MKYTHNGIDYESDPIWILLPYTVYLEMVHEDLEKINGGPDGMNLLIQEFSAINIAGLIINGIDRFKHFGLPPEFIAAIVTEVIHSNIARRNADKGVN